MRSYGHPCFLVAVLCIVALGQEQPNTEFRGAWNGTYADSVGSGSISFVLATGNNGTISGTYKTNVGGIGTVTGTSDNRILKFILTATTEACSGSFTGTLRVDNGKGAGTYWGNDCRGRHDNGVISILQGSPDFNQAVSEAKPVPQDSATSIRQSGDFQICGCKEGATLTLIRGGNDFSPTGTVRCGDQVSVVGHEGNLVEVRSREGKDGYISGVWVCKTGTDTKPYWSEAKYPSTGTSATQAFLNASGSLALRVLQTEQVPYMVQYRGGHVDTQCYINGSVQTNGSATSLGGYTNWSSNSYPKLSMSCNSTETPQMGWRHVLSAMLVVASDENAYVIACDAAWRWSNCRGLRPGDTFSAHWAKGGLSVTYITEKGKEKEATYSVLVSRSLK